MGFLARFFLYCGKNWLCGATPSHGLFYWSFMAYTAADIATLKAALLTIAERGAAEVEINGRRVRYIDINKLQELIEVAEAEVNSELYGGSLPISFSQVDD